MMIFMRYQPQENSNSPEDEVVDIEEHELELYPIHGEVIACVGCQQVVSHAQVEPQNER